MTTRRVCVEHRVELADAGRGVECPTGHAIEGETWDVVDAAGRVLWRVREGHARAAVEWPRGRRLTGRDAEGMVLGGELECVVRHGSNRGYQLGCRCWPCRGAHRAIG